MACMCTSKKLNPIFLEFEMHTTCSTKEMSAHQAKLCGPFTHVSKLSLALNLRSWKLESVKMYNILGTSWIEFGIFSSTLRGICAKMVPNHSEDSLRFLRMAESLQLSCCHLQSCARLSKWARSWSLCVQRFPFRRWAVAKCTTARYFNVLRFSQIPSTGLQIAIEH